jgi:hypothetical protein
VYAIILLPLDLKFLLDIECSVVRRSAILFTQGLDLAAWFTFFFFAKLAAWFTGGD